MFNPIGKFFLVPPAQPGAITPTRRFSIHAPDARFLRASRSFNEARPGLVAVKQVSFNRRLFPNQSPSCLSPRRTRESFRGPGQRRATVDRAGLRRPRSPARRPPRSFRHNSFTSDGLRLQREHLSRPFLCHIIPGRPAHRLGLPAPRARPFPSLFGPAARSCGGSALHNFCISAQQSQSCRPAFLGQGRSPVAGHGPALSGTELQPGLTCRRLARYTPMSVGARTSARGGIDR